MVGWFVTLENVVNRDNSNTVITEKIIFIHLIELRGYKRHKIKLCAKMFVLIQFYDKLFEIVIFFNKLPLHVRVCEI